MQQAGFFWWRVAAVALWVGSSVYAGLTAVKMMLGLMIACLVPFREYRKNFILFFGLAA